MSLVGSHFPVQAPKKYLEACKALPKARQLFCASMAAYDEAIKNVTEALQRKGLYQNTIIVLTSDNGGSTNFGANNFPLRGNKGTLWEGGTRVPAFVHSPLLQYKRYRHNGLFHIVDWYPTFLSLAEILPDKPLDGVNIWPAISYKKESPRKEFPYSVDIFNNTILSAVRVGKYKLIAGPGGNSDTWVTEAETTDHSFDPEYLNEYVSVPLPFNFSEKHSKLFNLEEDPYEKYDLARTRPEIVKSLWPTLIRYVSTSKPAIKFGPDPAGDPVHFDGVFTPGWCIAYEKAPLENPKDYSNQNIFSWYRL